MSEFKGTEEKWIRDGNLVFAEDYFQSHIASTCGAYTTDIEEANARLISKAPEMLEMLKDILEVQDSECHLDPYMNDSIKQLIKEATTII